MSEENKNKKLQQYFKYFCEYSNVENKNWYKSLKHWVEILQEIKSSIDTEKIYSYEELDELIRDKSNYKKNKEDAIDGVADFLERYLFKPDNGTANIGQGNIYDSDKNPDRSRIRDCIKNNPTDLLDILKESNFKTVSDLIENLIDTEKRNHPAVRFRFLKTLFPENFTSVEAVNKFERLVKILDEKLSIKVVGSNILEKHNWLMNQLEGVTCTKSVDNYKKHIFYWELYGMLENDLDLKKAIVYYGAPGTGKTYKAKKEAEKLIYTWAMKTNNVAKDKNILLEIVQFHPSFSYEDFIEGIRPSNDKDSKLKLMPGIFKSFCKKAGDIELKLYKDTNFLEIFKNKSFSDITIKELRKENIRNINDVIKNIDKLSEGLTLQESIEPALFIIDEINRADLSRVFGELMYSLEYRGYEGKIKTQYSYLNKNENDESIFFWEDKKDWFFIPQNVYIIGTMNTIDRSVDSFDFALRRRFMWEEVEPDYSVIENELSNKNNLAKSIAESFEELNKMIKKDELLGSDYQIGHSYALNINSKIENGTIDSIIEARSFLWKEFIKPLIQEYLRGLGDSKRRDDKLKKFKNSFGIS